MPITQGIYTDASAIDLFLLYQSKDHYCWCCIVGVTAQDNRRFVEGITWVERTQKIQTLSRPRCMAGYFQYSRGSKSSIRSFLQIKGYDADHSVEATKAMESEVVIPTRSNRKQPRVFDKALDRERNSIERMFNKIKHFQCVATRYDKTASAYFAFVPLASICLWLKSWIVETS